MSGNRLSLIETWDLVAPGYVSEIAPFLEKWALDSFERVGVQSEHLVVDVATGPGTVALLLAPQVAKVVALDFSPRMIGQLERQIKSRGIGNVQAEICDCQSLPFEENTFDRAFSQFGIMFFPDRPAGFREMHRVLKPNGCAAVYSWAPVDQCPAMTLLMNALFEGFPEARPKDNESKTIVHGLDDLETFRSEMVAAGFVNVEIEEVEHRFPRQTPDEFWASMVKGSAPITLMKDEIDSEAWEAGSRRSIQYLRENLEDVNLTSKAYLAIGSKP